MKNQSQKIVVITGPTASGKSDLGIKLAKKFKGEIISADSRQVYRGMDIGTGKVKRDKHKVVSSKYCDQEGYYSERIRHHLIDVAAPKRQFTVARFQKIGRYAIKNILKRNQLPIVIGGTGLYVDALVYDLNFPRVPPNKLLRLNLNKFTAEQLFHKLKNLDPQRAKTIDPKNKRRLIRALEILESGQKVPALNTKYYLLNTNYTILWLGLKPKNLEERIKVRLKNRLGQGMIREVKNLLKSGVSHKRLYDFGLEYRWVSKYLQGKITKEMLKTELLTSIIKYSKRQITWFKRNKEIHWVKTQREAEKLLKKFISAPL